MGSDTTEAFATRVDAELAEQFKRGVEQTDQTKSDVLGYGLWYLVDENPLNIPAWQSDEKETDYLAQLDILEPPK